MKVKILFCLLALTLSNGLSAQSDLERAQKIYEWMCAAQGDSVMACMNDQVKSVVNAEMLGNTFGQLQMQLGGLKSVSEWHQSEQGGVKLYFRDLVFTYAPVRFLLAFDPDGLANTIRFTPIAPNQVVADEEKEDVEQEDVEPEDGITESSVVIQTGSFELPGTLTRPEGMTKVPLLILVHGSGPNDRDESVGGTRIFRDLAVGLAKEGVAVLRYDKRTKVYGTACVEKGREMDFDTETVDDVLSAIRQAHALEGVDTAKIFVLGHSMGGMLLPRIVQRAPQGSVAGGIILAGPTRPLEVLLKEQLTYLSVLKGSGQSDIDAQVKQVLASLPASYRAMEQTYRPVEVAASLQVPLLVLQGERDYQVTMDDFSQWRRGLDAHKNVLFKSYPRLNHVLQEGEGKSVPDEYLQRTEVPECVIKDILSFIQSF